MQTMNSSEDNTALNVDLELQSGPNSDALRADETQNRPRDWEIFRWARRSRSKGEIFPLRKTVSATTRKGDHPEATALHLRAIELLFGLPADDAAKWPGTLVFCRYLESCFEELRAPQFDIIWKIISRDSPLSRVDCWHWCFAVIETFEGLRDSNASIEKAYQRLIENSRPRREIKAREKIQVHRAMFAVLCWTSATLKPLLDDEATGANADAATSGVIENSSSLAAENTFQKYSSKDLRRPIGKMFYSFRGHAQDAETSEHHPASSGTQINSGDVLYESSLNYFSLYTIGRVRLQWVDTLTAHLAFDRPTRTLYVFRFPSFCVANMLCKHDIGVLKNITTKLLPSYYYADSPQDPSAIYREILLTYRLLFGQTSRSRKLLSQQLDQLTAAATTHGHHATISQSSPCSSDGIADEMDPFLATICTSPLRLGWCHLSFARQRGPSASVPSSIFPSSALDLNGQLQESDTYSARDDFPIFGSRLLTLQHYITRQQPSKVKDLWRDRRNPLQWYTFWAVLWIGGASMLLAVLQLLVGVAQLYFAISPKGGNS